ncbi:MAG TPA: HAD family hydrolase, partial [Lapidilactobacillus dextrinicus]|nr:HAD family hydrolase [Lapidilactobacillus dextrinicus]
EETLYKNPIPRQDINQIVANARALKRPVAIATSDQIIANGQDTDLVDYFAFARQEVMVSDEFEHLMLMNRFFK